MNTEILPTHTPELFAAAVRKASELLRCGEVVALPTETVYGLASNALAPEAVARLFEIKQRPARNPIIVHVAGVPMARRCVSTWNTAAEKLASAFWPGPLTLVLPRAADIPDIVTAGGATVAVRWPSHPFIQAVIRDCGFPLAAPSANTSERVSPTNAAHVASQLGGRIPVIIDGGQSQVGIESTVIDLTQSPPRLLRPGMIHAPSLAAVIGAVAGQGIEVSAGEPLRSPGQMQRHYAPRAKMIVRRWTTADNLKSEISNLKFAPARSHVIAHTQIPAADPFGGVSVIPHDPDAFARALYAELHRCDDAGAELIVVESVPESPEWKGIADRLERGSFK